MVHEIVEEVISAFSVKKWELNSWKLNERFLARKISEYFVRLD
jgi:hypothetical protein